MGTQPARDRGARSAGRTAGGSRAVPRIAGDAPQGRVGKARGGEFRCRCFADHDSAGSLQPFDDYRVPVGHPVLQQARTAGCYLAPGRREVLDRNRNALERTRLARDQPLFGSLCLFQGFLGKGETETVEGFVYFFDTRQGILHDFDR